MISKVSGIYYNSYIQMLFLGADTVILARLAPGNDQIKTDTQEHLDVSLYRSIIYLKLYKGRSYILLFGIFIFQLL